METRLMDWMTEQELTNELYWLGEGEPVPLADGTKRPLSEIERAGAVCAADALMAQAHDEPDLSAIDYAGWSEERIDEAEQELSQVAVSLPPETWALIDALCVGVDFGAGLGVVGTRKEAA